MKVTLFTYDKIRHNYLIYLLSQICEKLFVVQEISDKNCVPDNYINSEGLKKYFRSVEDAQNKFFQKQNLENLKNTSIIQVPSGSINKLSMISLRKYLKSDIYLVFGSSYIKGDLINFLVKNKTINIHMGVSPYYRGTDCNFWALYDGNPHLVGSTIHYLSKGLDNGPMLYHALSKIKDNPFEYTMSTVKAAFVSVVSRIKDGSILKIKPLLQKKNSEIRYSKKKQFNEKFVMEFFNMKIDLNSKKFDNSLLKDPYFIEK